MPKIEIGYYKPIGNLDFVHTDVVNESLEETANEQTSWDPLQIDKIQQYQPIYSLFFDMTETNYNQIQLNHRYHFINSRTVYDTITKQQHDKSIFIKFAPLYDPIRYMMGKYDLKDSKLLSLPNIHSDETNCPQKFLDRNNASYTDCFFSYLSSQLYNLYGFKNGIDFYGSFLGIQKKYRMNIADDYSHLYNSTFFRTGCNKLFHFSKSEHSELFYNMHHTTNSRANKTRLDFADDADLELNIETLEIPTTATSDENSETPSELTEILYKTMPDTMPDFDKNENMEEFSNAVDDDKSSDSEQNYSTDSAFEDDDECNSIGENSGEDVPSESGSESNSDSDSESSSQESEEILNIYIDNFPIQMICMERCFGTFDELFAQNEIDEKTGASALFQIVMTLLAYQKAFQFTHNDLHTNNIMYIETDEPFLYYKFNKTIYRVPTYGRIFKIIDFGRSIYKFCGKQFCSDSFGPGGDASTQYNFEPYYNPNKPILEPNYSFDLCRLGTSIFDFLFDIEDMEDPKDMDGLQKTVYRWCQDDAGKNVLYKKNGEERYPNFKLYKMIARTVHQHTPEKQLEFKYFQQFKYTKPLKGDAVKKVMDLDKF